jgi:integrase
MKGHIRARSPGHYAIVIDTRDPQTGKRKRRWHSFRGTKRQAQIECARLVAASDGGTDVESSKMTLATFLDRWERDWLPGHTAARTALRYSQLMQHVRVRIGNIAIQKLRPVHLSELYATLLREGRGESGHAPRTVGHVHKVLHRALGIAKQWGIVKDNVASAVKPPKVQAEEIDILQPAQAQAVLNALRGKSLYLIAAMALATGMRRNELLALRWQDVDLDAGRLRVELSLEQTTKHGIRFKAPKTRHGRRTIALPSHMVAELRAHWRAQQEQRMALGLGKAPPDSQVLATFDGKPRSPGAVTRGWGWAMAKAGMPKVTLHSLRHTHASMLIASGMDILTISRRLGHGSPTITLAVYGHLLANTDDKAAAIMDAAFARANGSKAVAIARPDERPT